MTNVNMTQLLAEMQRLAGEARSLNEAVPSTDFSDLLRASIDQVNRLQGEAAGAAESFEHGTADNLPEVMIALQKASLSFQAMTEVRNHLVSAYQEIMNMPI